MSSTGRRPDYTCVEQLTPDLKYSYALWVDGDKATFVVSAHENGKWWVKFKRELRSAKSQLVGVHSNKF